MKGARVRVVLATGGTGGHVFPAEALGAQLRERGIEPVLFTDRRGGSFGAETAVWRIGGGAIAGQTAFGRVRSLAALGTGCVQAGWGLHRVAAAAVVGFGGYASVPTVLAAGVARLPTIIHEQNAVLGRANRLLAKRVVRIATAFEAVAGLPQGTERKVVRTGMPVRPSFSRLSDRSYQPPDSFGPVRLLVLGGSQGARVFGEVVPAAVDRLTARWRSRLAIAQQCRPESLDAVEEAYRRIGIHAELSAFFEDIPQRLASAHLVISRAGASSVAEITAVGCPAILVPYPFAVDDHQTVNATFLANAGAAWMTSQSEFTPEHLSSRLEHLFEFPDSLAQAAAGCRAAGFDRAAARLADLVLEVMGAAPPQQVDSRGRLAA